MLDFEQRSKTFPRGSRFGEKVVFSFYTVMKFWRFLKN
eukprot:UN01628